jgi:hypothetical protein
MRKPFRQTYHPPKLDARVNEARVMLAMRPHLNGITPLALECQFRLKPATAERLLCDERARRGNA